MYNKEMIILVNEPKNLKEKIIGLIGRKEPTAFMIKTHFGIHTFGLKFPIDVLVLNGENRIIKLKENLKPNRIFVWNPLYEKVLELPAGTIDRKEMKINGLVQVRLLP